MNTKARLYSIAVFGATGFTGQRVLAELVQQHPQHGPYAAAGRSAASLQAVLTSLGTSQTGNAMGSQAGHTSPSSQPESLCGVIADVDVSDYASVLSMCKQARLVIACVGPFRLHGESVVRACVEAGTHYVDVCGEPEFIERMEFKYGAQAAAAGLYMASACGLDSVPGDLGTVLAQSAFQPPSVPSSVETYLTLKPGPLGYKIHYATWQSAVLGLGSVSSLRRLRSEIRASGRAPPAPKPAGPRPRNDPGLAYCDHPAVKAWHLPFPGADISVVKRTQAALAADGLPPVHAVARFTLASRYYGYVTVLLGGLMALLARFGWGRSLLLRYPSLFSYGLVSHAGPSEQQMQETQTVSTFVARGYRNGPPDNHNQLPDREVVVQIVAPDPGYKATAIFVTQAALTILQEPSALPAPGVHTPGHLLRKTSYVERLRARGVSVTTVSDKNV